MRTSSLSRLFEAAEVGDGARDKEGAVEAGSIGNRRIRH